ncbi:hypothetical protein JMJ58_11880 [Haloterrigena salifodinae]|uniref:Uncharacterized protein n=1 Tax=Haloterrigena salifodinae TaxID=2675099 RepID=A0A8T8DVM5_9EURY|nr:hypothetical protein [Haloterrigena salifodinae]QRV13654.1 hypothetical protein JMJ58_11880 [Haloterrigena salifodinae]
MSQTTSPSAAEQLSDRLEAGTERLLRETTDGEPSDSLSATAAELWDVVEEVEDLLETIDLENLPDVVETSALPDLLELDGLPDAIREKDLDQVLDLSTIRRAVNLHELWNTVDLVDFQRELRQLKAELEDVVGPDALDSSGDSEAAAEVRSFIDEIKPDAADAAIQQKAKKAAKTARNGVIEGHSKFETLYESKQRGSGYAGRKPVSNNPTAVSSVPYGPLPAGISTRVSTVPGNVRGAKVNALPRIYGRRWKTARRPR